MEVFAGLFAEHVEGLDGSSLDPPVLVLEELAEEGECFRDEDEVFLLEGVADGHEGLEGGAPAVCVVAAGGHEDGVVEGAPAGLPVVHAGCHGHLGEAGDDGGGAGGELGAHPCRTRGGDGVVDEGVDVDVVGVYSVDTAGRYRRGQSCCWR